MSSFKIIADSGSTKTDWVIVDEGFNLVDRIKSVGFNPYFQSSEFIFNEVSKAFGNTEMSMNTVNEVFYYGAGCSSIEKKRTVENALTVQFPKAKVHIGHDLVGAARACLGNEKGIACIIGTGSNSCIWEDGKVVSNIPSHGYIFGDEGSGSFLGIELIKLYLEGGLDDNIKAAFEKTFKLSEEQILNSTYKEKDPNVFLARFAIFYHPNLHHQFLADIIYRGFDDFFKKRVIPYDNYKDYSLGFVGSIAYYYKDILAVVADKYGVNIKKVSQCPIDELVKFHAKNTTVNAL